MLSATADLFDAADRVAAAQADLDAARAGLADAIADAHAAGLSFAAIADRLGISRQYAHQLAVTSARYPPKETP